MRGGGPGRVVQAQWRLACACNRLKWKEGARACFRRRTRTPKKVAFETVFSNILRTVASCGLLQPQLAAACIRVLLYGEGWGRAKSTQVNVTRHTSYVIRHTSHVTRHMPHLQSLSSRIPNVLIFSASQLPWFRLAADDAAPCACTRVRGSGLHFQGFRVASLGVRKTHVQHIHTHTCWRRDNGL